MQEKKGSQFRLCGVYGGYFIRRYHASGGAARRQDTASLPDLLAFDDTVVQTSGIFL